MQFFQLLFAANYSLLIKLRRNRILRYLNHVGQEDFAAMIFVILSQFYLLITVLIIFKEVFHVDIEEFVKLQGNAFIFLIVFLIAIWIYLGNRYFVSNRERRNFFLDKFGNLSEKLRIFWKFIALFFMLVPVWYLIILFLIKKT